MKIIDCRGLTCPKPVIMTKKEMEAISEGEFEVIVDNEVARDNVSKYVKSEGLECSIVENKGEYHISVKKTKNACECMEFNGKTSIAILIGSNTFGDGDDKLGAALMKSYLYALSESDKKPVTLLFANSGVKLTTEGSEVLESLKALEGRGVEILSCGTCLDFYGLKEKLAIGSITNMYTIVDKLNSASNAIKL